MKQVVRIKFGSHLYGTSTPMSDTDYKTVVIPNARDILLQRTTAVENNRRPKAFGEKNKPEDVDDTVMSLQFFMELLARGDTTAVDMLFAPHGAMTEAPSPMWDYLVLHRDKLLTKKSKYFVKYCQDQAAKYGIKGSRVAAARLAVATLQAEFDKNPRKRVGSIEPLLQAISAKTPHLDMVVHVHKTTGNREYFWQVCEKKIPLTISFKDALPIAQKIFAEYGARALLADHNEGVDWKAMSHAVRVGIQALQLLKYEKITFPLEEAPYLLQIKQGVIPYSVVAARLELLLQQVEEASITSNLRDEVDQERIDEFVMNCYYAEVAQTFDADPQ